MSAAAQARGWNSSAPTAAASVPRDGGARPAHLPRPEAARHSQHRRQGRCRHCARSIRRSSPSTPPADAHDGRCQGGRAGGCKVVAVTVLTSLDGNDLASIGVGGDPQVEQVLRLTELARAPARDRWHRLLGSGGEGSARALAGRLLRRAGCAACGRRGRRPEAHDDAAPIALDAGASILVVSRPITQAEDPDRAARAIEATL